MTQFTQPPDGTPEFHAGVGPGPAPPRKSNVIKWVIVLVIGVPVSVCVAIGAVCMYIGAMSPDTKVLSGRQVPARFIRQIRDLGVLQADEQIEYFYSDALTNIENGFYLLTDRNVVVYSREFEEPAIIVPLEDIVDAEAEYSDTWLEDGTIVLTLSDGTSVSFPVSSQGGGDRRMFSALKKKAGLSDGKTKPTGESDPKSAESDQADEDR